MNDFFNLPLGAALLSWLIAQMIKMLTYLLNNRKINFERLLGAGGMPSSHSAAVCAIAVAIARTQGADSAVFAVSAILALIVMYDASGVRRAAGMHAKEINQIKNIIEEWEAENRVKLEEPDEEIIEEKKAQ
ncbi:MAG: divergent PAP2 family protein, partial [Oscillospiraceae bacterium]|nr:divergent PAP2 family protein [Oscillospiraceae bacterium]